MTDENPPTPQSAPGAGVQTNSLALVSMILGIVGIFLFCAGSYVVLPSMFSLLSGLATVITGHISLRQIKKSQGRQTGDGMAIAGLILGYLQIAGAVILGIASAYIIYGFSTTQ